MCQSRRMWEQALQAAVVRWIFDCYVSGNSLGKIADRLKEQGIPPSTGKPTWNWKAISKLLSNEKYTERVLLQNTISLGSSQIKNNGRMVRYLITGAHAAIISDETFREVQMEKQRRTNIREQKPMLF